MDENFTTEEMAAEMAESYRELGYSDDAAENLNDRMRDAGIPKAERFARITKAHTAMRDLPGCE